MKISDNLSVRYMKSGLKVQIWWVPGNADSATSIAIRHPDWYVKNKDGSIHRSYKLCPAYKPVQEYYTQLVQKFVEDYKLDGFKEDFGRINGAASLLQSNSSAQRSL